MNHGFRGHQLLVPLIILLSALLPGGCKKTPSSQRGGGAGKSRDTLIKEAMSRGAIAPQFREPLSAEVSRIGSTAALKAPRGVAVDKQGNIYVADTGNFRVVKLDSSGRELASFGKQGAGPGEFSQPWKVAISGNGRVFVLDRESTWIHVFTPDGRFLTSLAGPKMQLYSPGGLVIAPDGTIVVVDTGLNRLLPLTADGQRQGEPITTIAGEPLKQPTDAAFDSNGGLHVYQSAGDQNPSLLLHRATRGEAETKWIGMDSSSTLDSARLAVGADGRIYLTDPVMRRLLVYSSDGKSCYPIKMEGPVVPPFDRLTGIALDSKGSVYVSDAAASAIYRFRLRSP